MKLNLRCAMCGTVRETEWDVEELINASPDEVCPHCFICKSCLSDECPMDEPREKRSSPSEDFLWAAAECFRLNGPPPVIGTFKPEVGDVGRDSDSIDSQLRVWTGSYWHPNQ